ncbi:MAG: hypothetical protein M0R80_11340 [Proteobacteria bacterium]|jgi:hypothetical protein|nr:hypothetical protein [Pseudomonadota bacterium]
MPRIFLLVACGDDDGGSPDSGTGTDTDSDSDTDTDEEPGEPGNRGRSLRNRGRRNRGRSLKVY